MPLMRNSRMADDWVQRAVASNPFSKLENGNFRTCPVRLAFVHILRPNPKATNDDGTPKADPSYEVTALCPPGAMEQINSLIWPEVYATLKAEWPQQFNAQGMPFGLHIPWRDQGEKQNYNGYTAGLPFLRMTTQYKPQIVDPAQNPIVEDSRVYPGVWAILSFNIYGFGKSPPRPKKGVSLGLQAVMIIADDEKLAGGAPDVKQEFAGVTVDARFDAAGAFGGAPPVPSSIMPPPAVVGGAPPGYTAGVNYPPPQPPGTVPNPVIPQVPHRPPPMPPAAFNMEDMLR